MSHLIREKRVNKNGVAVTKVVRASKPATAGNAMPAPSLGNIESKPKRKPLTTNQTTVMSRIIRVDSNEKDHALFDALKATKKNVGFPLSANLVGYSISASDEQIFSVLSVAAPCNAMAMVSAGITTGEEAERYLTDHGFEHLIQDHADHTQQALERRMSPDMFLSGTEWLSRHKESPAFLDAVEAYHMKSLKAFNFIPDDVATGHTKLSDIKAIGAGRLKTMNDKRLVRLILGELGSDTAGYTAQHAKKFIEQHVGEPSEVLDSSFALSNRFGGDFVLSLSRPDSQLRSINYKLYDQKASDERSMSVIKYADRVSALMRQRYRYGKTPASVEDIIIFHDAGIDPEVVAEGNITALQADAIKNHGITPSVADGWL